MEKYNSYEKLSQDQVEGKDYRIRIHQGKTLTAVMAPHGGGIEPGTTEIAEAIAAGDHTFYTFSGIKPSGNQVLHITSCNFDEPRAVAIAQQAQTLITIHGCRENEKIIFLGGRDRALLANLERQLVKAGFNANAFSRFPAVSPRNICNRNRRNRGVQFEISLGLRRTMFKKISRLFRKKTTPVFDLFVRTIRTCLDHHQDHHLYLSAPANHNPEKTISAKVKPIH